jgi:hypothetical protein
VARISSEAAKDLCTKLDDFKQTLSEEQQQVFVAILKFAWQSVAKGDALKAEFDGCFTPKQGELIQAYSSGTADFMIGMMHGSIIRGDFHVIRG